MAVIRLFQPTNLADFSGGPIREHNSWAWGAVAVTTTGVRFDYDAASEPGIAALRVSHSGRIAFEISSLGIHRPSEATWDAYFSGNQRPFLTGMLEGDDFVIGSAGNDRVMGHQGNDRIYAGGGADWLGGATGDDVLNGGDGNDTLSGGDGADRLLGAAGNDNLLGGAGADRFIFFAGQGTDLIADFQDGVDKIDIWSGATSFADIQVTDSGANTVIQFGGNRVILANVDHQTIDATDFWFA